MSGLPIDMFDPQEARPMDRLSASQLGDGRKPRTAMSNVLGYYFNPAAFAQAIVPAGSLFPAHDSTALAGEDGTDLGRWRNVARTRQQNGLRSPGASH
jgi:hypothetical protein